MRTIPGGGRPVRPHRNSSSTQGKGPLVLLHSTSHVMRRHDTRLITGMKSFKALHECCEPSMFSLDRLVLSVITDPRVTLDGLLRARELALQVVEKEKRLRAELSDIGLQASERLSTPDSHRKKKSRFIEDEEENMCEVCRQNLYVALVTNSQEEAVYCLEHALIFLKQNPTHLEYCKLMYTYSLSELDISLKQMDERIHIKSGKKSSPNTKRTKTREHLDSVSSTSSSNL
ncbi:putative jumonji/arid domain-containing protein [Penaeus vannamei]|uniref:Putative jumonji/arid domain-containing protein n=1 Tax=Penaeus vannamei TaxID=6689 RepID=A0A423U2W2_PENVA|nr:putative jumonji/arid domain-containing protein [Penaeus vannamei]